MPNWYLFLKNLSKTCIIVWKMQPCRPVHRVMVHRETGSSGISNVTACIRSWPWEVTSDPETRKVSTGNSPQQTYYNASAITTMGDFRPGVQKPTCDASARDVLARPLYRKLLECTGSKVQQSLLLWFWHVLIKNLFIVRLYIWNSFVMSTL